MPAKGIGSGLYFDKILFWIFEGDSAIRTYILCLEIIFGRFSILS